MAHWGCLAKTQRDEILKAIYEKDKAKWELPKEEHANNVDTSNGESSGPPEPKKRAGLETNETTEFICGSCMKGGTCMSCKEIALKPGGILVSIVDKAHIPDTPTVMTDGDAVMAEAMKEGEEPSCEDQHASKLEGQAVKELLFRCMTCKRVAHYSHLPPSRYAKPEDKFSPDELATWYQSECQWQCAECVSFTYSVEHVIAWRPFPGGAVEPRLQPGEQPNYKSALPREYLIKWVDRSYKRVQWVPHMWLLATHQAKLKNFLAKGSHVLLLPEPVTEDAVDTTLLSAEDPTFDNDEDGNPADIDGSAKANDVPWLVTSLPDAEKRIPPGWKTIDRVLDVLLWKTRDVVAKQPGKAIKKKQHALVLSDDDDAPNKDPTDLLDDDALWERKLAYDEGEQPGENVTETAAEFEKRKGRRLREGDIGLVAWGFFKWNGLGYEDGKPVLPASLSATDRKLATWESPPPYKAPGWPAFKNAFRRFLVAQTVTVASLPPNKYKQFDGRPKNVFMKKYKFTPDEQPQLGQDKLKLMPFQVDGVNWLCNNWWNLQHCILADEMGLVSQ